MKKYLKFIQLAFVMMAMAAIVSCTESDILPDSENKAPVINDQIFTIDENSAVGTSVGFVTSTDEDGDEITFSITDGNTNSTLEINVSTGEVTVGNSSALDYETMQTLEIVVTVSDGVDSNQAIITVNINDVDEGGSTIGEFSYAGDTYEIKNARLFDEGVEEGTSHYNYYFIFTDGAFESSVDDDTQGMTYVLYFDLYHNGTAGWSPGTYTVGSTDGKHPWVYMWKDINKNNDDDAGDEFYVEKSGTIVVSQSGNSYTFTIDVLLEDEDGVAADKELSGTFNVELTPI